MSKIDHTNKTRELTEAELEKVTGGNLVCAKGEHFKIVTIALRSAAQGG
jgi:bacteriocin-like protein